MRVAQASDPTVRVVHVEPTKGIPGHLSSSNGKLTLNLITYDYKLFHDTDIGAWGVAGANAFHVMFQVIYIYGATRAMSSEYIQNLLHPYRATSSRAAVKMPVSPVP